MQSYNTGVGAPGSSQANSANRETKIEPALTDVVNRLTFSLRDAVHLYYTKQYSLVFDRHAALAPSCRTPTSLLCLEWDTRGMESSNSICTAKIQKAQAVSGRGKARGSGTQHSKTESQETALPGLRVKRIRKHTTSTRLQCRPTSWHLTCALRFYLCTSAGKVACISPPARRAASPRPPPAAPLSPCMTPPPLGRSP